MAHGREIGNLTPDGLIGLLSSVSCGAFVLTTDQTVVFWNDRAQKILGYAPERVVGRRCSAVAGGVVGVTLSEGCEDGCPMMRSLRGGQMPGRARWRARCSWGEWKWLVVTPMAVSGVEQSGPLLVYLFGDSGEEAPAADVERLVALGMPGRSFRQERDLFDARRAELLRDMLFREYRPTNEGSPFLDHPMGSAEPGERINLDGLQFDWGAGPETRQSAEPVERGDAGSGATPQQPEIPLTHRQLEVLSYLALGWETKYIARRTGCELVHGAEAHREPEAQVGCVQPPGRRHDRRAIGNNPIGVIYYLGWGFFFGPSRSIS